ncbi:UNC50-like protein, partial [Mya arenaria]
MVPNTTDIGTEIFNTGKVSITPFKLLTSIIVELLIIKLKVSSVGFFVVLGLAWHEFIKFLLWMVFVDCIGVGLLVAIILWFFTNRYMLIAPPRGQDVEWAYAFDVHLNAYFPLVMILHLFQLPFLNTVIIDGGFFGRIFGNTLWLLAISYYIYITFLGYSALPFLKNTRTMLFPVTAVLVIYLLSLILSWNFSQGLRDFYKYRVSNK